MSEQKITLTAKIKSALDFSEAHYAGLKTFSGLAVFDHCKVVARQAETIAKKLYQDVKEDFLPNSVRNNIGLILQAGLLHETLNVGSCSFEKIAGLSGAQVATTVADISRDYRLIETKRDIEFRGRVSQSSIAAQIIVLADIIATVRELDAFLQANGPAVSAKAKKILTQNDGDLLALHPINRYYILRLYAHAAKNSISALSQKITEQKKAAKLQKFLERKTKTLREKVAAKKATSRKKTTQPKTKKRSTKKPESSSLQEKGVSRGKKSSRKN